MASATGKEMIRREAAAQAHWVRVAVVALSVAVFVAYVAMSWRWELQGDPQVMHYVVFLMHHGFAPYTQIGDMNMPGAYMAEQSALAVFGHSDLGWRLYDFTLGLITCGAMVAIARRTEWVAGLAAGVLFACVHAADGPKNAGQRDQVMAVLLVVSCAFLFEAVRRRRAWLMLPFALTSALAASIKPTVAPVGVVLLVLAVWVLRRERQSLARYVLWALVGFAIGTATSFGFLMFHHSTRAFFTLLTHVEPQYVTIEPKSWMTLVHESTPLPVGIFVGFAIVAALLAKRRTDRWESVALLLCAFFGAVSYFAQRKGFVQHRYTMLAFLLLWAAIEIATALKAAEARRVVAWCGVLVALLYLVPRELMIVKADVARDQFTDYLQADLQTLGVPQLQHQVQCFDIIDGCMTALFHLNIVQNTGATGDLLLFLPGGPPPAVKARDAYMALIQQHPPAVYVISNWQFGANRWTFDKLQAFPVFERFLDKNYVLVDQRVFEKNGQVNSTPGTNPPYEGYRIYVAKDSPLLQKAELISGHATNVMRM